LFNELAVAQADYYSTGAAEVAEVAAEFAASAVSCNSDRDQPGDWASREAPKVARHSPLHSLREEKQQQSLN